ncbi:hypothetical protein VTK73DRAFT_4330 [Phialemonium thermophilum]|uniref:SURP motif domain-containing protein n=1 Tax=Phialemonium thermophilum TaxID=223376 RepID=A0ABR3V9H1_9PEZI
MPRMSQKDLEVVRLTALFVARNGRQFMTQLAQREAGNPQFQFLIPNHTFHNFFQSLVDQYALLLREGGVTSEGTKAQQERIAQLRRNVEDKYHVLARARQRAEYARWQEAEKQKREQEEEKKKLEFARIDWNDFVVVETIVFSEADEHANLPPPTTLNDLQYASLEEKNKMSISTLRIEEAFPFDETSYNAYPPPQNYAAAAPAAPSAAAQQQQQQQQQPGPVAPSQPPSVSPQPPASLNGTGPPAAAAAAAAAREAAGGPGDAYGTRKPIATLLARRRRIRCPCPQTVYLSLQSLLLRVQISHMRVAFAELVFGAGYFLLKVVYPPVTRLRFGKLVRQLLFQSSKVFVIRASRVYRLRTVGLYYGLLALTTVRRDFRGGATLLCPLPLQFAESVIADLFAIGPWAETAAVPDPRADESSVGELSRVTEVASVDTELNTLAAEESDDEGPASIEVMVEARLCFDALRLSMLSGREANPGLRVLALVLVLFVLE